MTHSGSREDDAGEPRRILYVLKTVNLGGAETLVRTLCKRTLDQGFSATVVHVVGRRPGLGDREFLSGVEEIHLGRRFVPWTLHLAMIVLRGGFDVIHVHSPLPGSVARLAARMLRRRPAIITTEHNSWPAYHPATRLLNRITIGLSDSVVTVSREALESLSLRAGRRAFALQHGIDFDLTRAAADEIDKDAIKASLALPADAIVLACVASFKPAKDHANLISALEIVRDAGVTFVCLLVGDGELMPEIQDKVRERNLGDHTRFLDAREDVAALLRCSDVAVLASRQEGFPVAVMEAVALGVPVVATRVGGIPDVMTDDENALLVAPGDPHALAEALQRAILSPDLRRRLAVSAAQLQPQLDVGTSSRRYLEMYTDLLGA